MRTAPASPGMPGLGTSYARGVGSTGPSKPTLSQRNVCVGVTWPLLAPALTINTVVMLITAFKAYDHIQVITQGGPGSGTTATVAFIILQTGFTANRQGYAAAMAIVMLLVVATASAVALRLLQRREVDL